MADIGDVATTLVNLISAALYPNGVSAGSPLGVNFRIYRGHPSPDVLDNDMQAGFSNAAGAWALVTPAARVLHVCVNPRAGMVRLLKPYVFATPYAPAPPAQTVTATVSLTAGTVTLGGTVALGRGVAIVANNVPVGVVAGTSDTLATLAAALAGLLTAAGVTASASNGVVTVTGATQLAANGFVQVPVTTEWRRQMQAFEVTIYAPGRDIRDATGAAIDQSLAQNKRFVLPDNFVGDLSYSGVFDDDKPEKALLFMRRLFYQVEYPTTAQQNFATIAVEVVPVSAGTYAPVNTIIAS